MKPAIVHNIYLSLVTYK